MFKEFVLKLLLRSALAYERDKERSYRTLAGHLSQPHLRELTLRMADEENEHIRHLEQLMSGDEKALRATVEATAPAEAHALDLGLESMPPEPGPEASEAAVLAYLRGRELAAHHFFALLAQRTLIPSARKVFQFLANEEARQLTVVETFRAPPPTE